MNDTRSSGAGVVWPGVTNNWFNGSANTVISTGSLSYGPLLTGGNQANLDNSGSSIFRAFDTLASPADSNISKPPTKLSSAP